MHPFLRHLAQALHNDGGDRSFEMRSPRTILFALITAFAVVLAAGPSQAVDFSAKELNKLKAGKAVKKPLPRAGDNGFYGGSGFALIDAPVEEVWEALLDWSSYRQVYPKTVDVREVSRKGARSLVRMELGHELISVAYFVDVRADRGRWQLDYKLVTNRPHDIEAAHGYWRLFPQKSGQTLVAYVVAVRVPMGLVNLIPPSLERKINRNLLASPEYLRTWMQGSAGSSRKP
jgi:ribosome-associated toxin RatA of RatAB toxin-antitoxin module